MEKKYFEAPTIYVSDLTIQVADLQRSIQFYQDFLGFQLIEEDGKKVRFSADGENTILTLEQPEDVLVKQKRTTGLFHFAILLPERKDLATCLKHLLEAGRAYSLQLGASDHLVSEALYFSDPDGNGIEIACDRPSAGWKWMGDSVQMLTDPLDAEGLLTEAEPEWKGMPEKTLIGHVHLHVNDLAKARKFYMEGLGFQETLRHPTASFLSSNGYHHHLAINTWNGEGAPVPDSKEAGLRFFSVRYPSQEAVEVIKERLLQLEFSVHDHMVQDPAGNTIYLSY